MIWNWMNWENWWGEEVSNNLYQCCSKCLSWVCLCGANSGTWEQFMQPDKQRELKEEVTGKQRYKGWETTNLNKANNLFPEDAGAVMNE